MKNKLVNIDKKDIEKIVLTDLPPYEVPIIFSNEGFYYFLRGEYKNVPQMISKKILDEGNSYTDKEFKYKIPFNYRINKNIDSYRTLSIIHPSIQKQFVEFYKKYDFLFINFCSKSPFSLRKPVDIATLFYDRELYDQDQNEDIELLDDQKHSSSYFHYQKYTHLYKFFDSYEYNRLEKKYSYYMSIDVSKCFYSIYTHSITWAVKDKKYGKKNSRKNSFENYFDKMMQKSNYNETNGIVVGPEISRIFAEIIFQDIDLFILTELNKKNKQYKSDYSIRRYIDDYFFFSNDMNLLCDIKNLVIEKLNDYKLFINESKTVILELPFISNISKAKIEVSSLIENKLYNLIILDNERKTVCFNPLTRHYKKSNYFITEIKKIISEYKLKYDDISGYIFSIFKRKIFKYFDLQYNIIDGTEKNAESILLFLLDVSFFLYSVSIKVNSTYTISNIIIQVIDYLKKLPNESKYNIKKKIFDEITFLINKILVKEKEPTIELMNLLIASKYLGEQYLISADMISSIFNLESNKDLNYFQIVTLLFYIDKKSIYKKMKDKITIIVTDKFLEEENPFEYAELAMLFLDIMSCPYLYKYHKDKILINAKLLKKNGKARKEIIDFCSDKIWFVNWTKPANIKMLLEKKEFRIGYKN